MGSSFRAILLPRDRGYSPSPQQLEHLLSRLVAETWLPSGTGDAYPGPDSTGVDDASQVFAASFIDSVERPVPFPVSSAWLEQLLARDSSILWSIEDYIELPVRFPFSAMPEVPLCEIVCHLPTDYAVEGTVFVTAETQPPSWLSRIFGRRTVDPFEASGAACDCGTSLEYKRDGWSYATERRLHATCPSCAKPFDPSGRPTVVRDNFGNEHRMMGGIVYRFAIYLDCDKALPGPPGGFSVQPDFLEELERCLGTPIDIYPQYY